MKQLETGKRTPVEKGVELAGLDFGSLTATELGAVQARRTKRHATAPAGQPSTSSRSGVKAEVARLRKRLDELSA